MKRDLRRTTRVLCLLSALAVGMAWPPRAMAQSEPDFKGKTVRVIIGTSSGGGVDLYARLVAQFLGKHLPGEPLVVPQNMPGASSLVAANCLHIARRTDLPWSPSRRSFFVMSRARHSESILPN